MSPRYSTEPRPSPRPPTKMRECGFLGLPVVYSKETRVEVWSGGDELALVSHIGQGYGD